ncbi:MAG: hypothetical protein FJW32_26425, partial [Acidobacteria bacterium]|nr:hypothetical protein [Acidobacteriota bacterium]
MPLAAGTKLGPYEVIAPLGAGGMGEVYKARDTRLNRDVALKILPEAFAHDSQRRNRFETEAKAVAALNHPNIVAVFDIGENFMVSELVDGETLRDAKLQQRKALDIAAQIADGLAAAHAKGITHRDLKPDNVMLTRDGRAKILDFGLAQRAPGSTDATLTAAGTVMGTAGYMSPEQVRGESVDARSDIFSFGALVYELLAGKRAFDGPTAVEAMNAVLKDDPQDLPDAVPAGVRELVRACLEKDKEQRFQSAKDLALALRALSNRGVATASEPLPVQKSATKKAPLWIAAATLLIGAVGGAKLALTMNEGDEQTRVTPLTFGLASKWQPAFSPDGRSVAYLQDYDGQTEIVVKSPGVPQPVVLARGNGFRGPSWTADGSRICYVARRDLWCVGSAGGTPQRAIENVTTGDFDLEGGDAYFIRTEGGKSKLFVSSPFGTPPKPLDHVVVPDASFIGRVAPNRSVILLAGNSGTWLTPLGTSTAAKRLNDKAHGTRWLPDSRHYVRVGRASAGDRFNKLILGDTQSESQKQLHASDGVIVSFDVSQDGRQIAFSHGRPEWSLVEYSTAGKKLRTLGPGWQGRWSPTGERAVYLSMGAERKTMTMGADGSTQSIVSTVAGLGAHYSPDGA